jgi:hypothetical protein
MIMAQRQGWHEDYPPYAPLLFLSGAVCASGLGCAGQYRSCTPVRVLVGGVDKVDAEV